MSREEIIAMGNEAALQHGHTYEPEPGDGTIEFLGSFAALVAAKEREACAIMCEVHAAAVINDGKQPAWAIAHECAAAIRARGAA